MAYHKSPRRSRSPAKDGDSRRRRHRSHSPAHHDHQSSSHRRSHPKTLAMLPFQASPLRKEDFSTYKPLFALYLDIQKQLDMEELSDDEIKGRWKSFLGRWNRGELAEGWYEPETLRKAQASAALVSRIAVKNQLQDATSGGDLSDDDVGPALPRGRMTSHVGSERRGPAIPSLQDLELQREQANEDSHVQRQDLRHERHLDRQAQKAHLDDLVPRAEPGSKERILEKKREKADNHRAFASAKIDAVGEMADVPEADLLGADDNDNDGGSGGIAGLQKQKREMERKKNEREIRREEMMRVRQAEREQRLREYKVREERTMSGLIALAKAKFG